MDGYVREIGLCRGMTDVMSTESYVGEPMTKCGGSRSLASQSEFVSTMTLRADDGVVCKIELAYVARVTPRHHTADERHLNSYTDVGVAHAELLLVT
jgi:hypothetical protein